MSAAPAAKVTVPAGEEFSSAKSTNGKITILTMNGVVAHGFDGKKLAGGVNTKKLIINMRQVRRFASWGMAEWMDFLRANEQRDVYLIEASTYATSQLNLITGLMGHAKLVSFYASYRCSSCSRELEMKFVVPNERENIRSLPSTDQVCPVCDGAARIEEYPAAFFDTIADRSALEIDEEVLGYFNGELKYDIQPDRSRFRAFRKVRDGATYMRISGSLTGLASEPLINASQGTTIVDLENAMADEADLSEWRRYVEGVMQKVPQLQLLNCPPRFLEQAVQISDLHHRMKVRTFASLYECPRCNIVTPHYIDVADNLEQLATGVVPLRSCAGCKSMLLPALSPAQIALVRALPARVPDRSLDKFIEKARSEPYDRLENALLLSPTDTKSKASRTMYIAGGVAAVLVLGMGGIGYMVWSDRKERANVNVTYNNNTQLGQPGMAVNPQVPKPAFERPDWVLSDIPSSGYCHDMINRLMCVGVSAYRGNRDEAAADASDAALDELVNAVGLKISDQFFRENIMSAFTDARNKALTALQAVDLDRKSDAYKTADTTVSAARKRVVDILQASGGAAVPAQRSDWYWEEYAADKGGTEFLVFVRYDVTMDAVKNLSEKYSLTTKVAGATVMTAFPALAWQFPEFKGGALVIAPSRPLQTAGAEKFDVIMSANDQRIADVVSLNRRLDEWQPAKGPLQLLVMSPEKPAHAITLKKK